MKVVSVPLIKDLSSLDLLSSNIKGILSSSFVNVSVNVENPGDLRRDPWKMTSKGIGGKRAIADIGGVGNLTDCCKNHTSFSLKDLWKSFELPHFEECHAFGPGAVDHNHTGINGELVFNSRLNLHNDLPSDLPCNSKWAFIDSTKNDGVPCYRQDDYRINKVGMLANLSFHDGNESPAIHFVCSQRRKDIADKDGPRLGLDHILQTGLASAYPSDVLALSGIFLIKQGSFRAHVMPEFTGKNMEPDSINDWLHFFEMSSPVTCLSVIVNRDPENRFGLRLFHTHFWSQHGDCGHYHFDLDGPNDVIYEGYLNPAQYLFKVHDS